MDNLSVNLHDHQPDQWTENPISIVTDCLDGGKWIIRIGEFALLTTPERATELRDKINTALASVKPAIEPASATVATSSFVSREAKL